MTPAPRSNNPVCDLTRFTPQQAAQVQHRLQKAAALFDPLPKLERDTYTSIWSIMAQATVPVSITPRQYPADVQKMLSELTVAGVLWYDADLRAVLQCPPFSALTTRHYVKAFGWSQSYACTFLDIPLTLLHYGPNTWLDVESACGRSGEMLNFRVLVGNDQVLQVQVPPEAVDWCIWVPEQITTVDGPGMKQGGAVGFYTATDFETFQDYNPDERGVVYTFDDALYFSECLMRVYKQALHL